MTKRSEKFGQLLKAGISSIANIEGKTTPIVEEDLGRQIGVASYTIQRYKTGHVPSDIRSVQLLAEACVRRGLLGRAWLNAFSTRHTTRHPTQCSPNCVRSRPRARERRGCMKICRRPPTAGS
jgi:hypothetical protein